MTNPRFCRCPGRCMGRRPMATDGLGDEEPGPPPFPALPRLPSRKQSAIILAPLMPAGEAGKAAPCFAPDAASSRSVSRLHPAQSAPDRPEPPRRAGSPPCRPRRSGRLRNPLAPADSALRGRRPHTLALENAAPWSVLSRLKGRGTRMSLPRRPMASARPYLQYAFRDIRSFRKRRSIAPSWGAGTPRLPATLDRQGLAAEARAGKRRRD
jgi:hypothetical protein